MLITIVEAERGQVAPGLVTGLVGDRFYVQTRYPNGVAVPEEIVRGTIRDLREIAHDCPSWSFSAPPALAAWVREEVEKGRAA